LNYAEKSIDLQLDPGHNKSDRLQSSIAIDVIGIPIPQTAEVIKITRGKRDANQSQASLISFSKKQQFLKNTQSEHISKLKNIFYT